MGAQNDEIPATLQSRLVLILQPKLVLTLQPKLVLTLQPRLVLTLQAKLVLTMYPRLVQYQQPKLVQSKSFQLSPQASRSVVPGLPALVRSLSPDLPANPSASASKPKRSRFTPAHAAARRSGGQNRAKARP